MRYTVLVLSFRMIIRSYKSIAWDKRERKHMALLFSFHNELVHEDTLCNEIFLDAIASLDLVLSVSK